MYFFFPIIVYAQETGTLSIKQLMYKISFYIINPLIIVGFVVALLYFIWGLIDFLRSRDTSPEKSTEGRSHMLYGIIGLIIMVSAFAIMRLIGQTIGSEIPTP